MRAVLPQTMERLFSHQTSGSKGKGMESTRNLAEELHSTCGQRCKATAVESTAINTKSPTTFFHQCLPSHPASAARLTLLFLPSPLHFLLRNHHHHHHHPLRGRRRCAGRQEVQGPHRQDLDRVQARHRRGHHGHRCLPQQPGRPRGGDCKAAGQARRAGQHRRRRPRGTDRPGPRRRIRHADVHRLRGIRRGGSAGGPDQLGPAGGHHGKSACVEQPQRPQRLCVDHGRCHQPPQGRLRRGAHGAAGRRIRCPDRQG
mmetsp:Transcript_20392/g.48150  ORF Transcript_20392/g.48150 Transcript_20392/m.48150 type:complete len:258 (+) Transcript_20392:391-1164(+)